MQTGGRSRSSGRPSIVPSEGRPFKSRSARTAIADVSAAGTAAVAVAAPAYFDSALVAQFYVNEPGRDAVRALARSAGVVVSSGIAIAEVSAAFHRKFREGAVDSTTFKSLVGQFEHDVEHGLWTFIGPTEALLLEVQRLFKGLKPSMFLRSLDALHLVTASSEGFERIYSNDRHLLAACASAGLKGVNPT